jgi:hypothetical protein
VTKRIEVMGRTVNLKTHRMPDGSYYVVGRFARALFIGEGETLEAAQAQAEAEAQIFERDYTKG